MRKMCASAWIAFGLAVLASGGCKKPPVEQKDNGGELAKQQAAKEAADKADKEKAAADAKKSVDDALKAFGAEASGTLEQRRKTYLAVLDAIEKAKAAMDTSIYKGLPVTAATPLFARLKQLDDDEVTDAKNTPNIPPKPEHDPPEYAGAFQLSGTVRKCYKDGVVLQSGAKYYFIEDGKCPDVSVLYGYVEPDGRTVNVDIGRDGRDAEVVKISDKESAADDRTAHRKAVADYEADYAKKLKEYNDASTGKETIVAELEKRRSARKTERETIWASLDTLLKPLAAAAAAGTDLSAVKLPSVPATASVKSAGARPTPALAVATGTSAPPPAAVPAPTTAPTFRADPYGTKPGDLPPPPPPAPTAGNNAYE